jgi:G3E family GTPase
MTDTYVAPEDRIALDTIVARLNVERFSKMLSEEADEAKRQILAQLITEEKAKLDELFPRAFT